MALSVRGLAVLAGLGAATAGADAHAGQRKPGVDPRQSGLDAAFVEDEPRSDLNRFRAHLGLDLVGLIRQTPWPRFGAGPVGPRDDAAALGYRRLGLGFGLGRGFADVVVIGVNFEYEITRGLTRTPWEPERSPKAIGFSALPYAEFMMARHKLVRPFFMVRAGVGGSIVTTDGSSPLEHRAGDTLSLLHPSIGAGLGAHAFLSPDVSLDGMVSFDHRWEYARGPRALPDPSSATMDTTAFVRGGRHDAFGRRFHATLGLAVSRWF